MRFLAKSLIRTHLLQLVATILLNFCLNISGSFHIASAFLPLGSFSERRSTRFSLRTSLSPSSADARLSNADLFGCVLADRQTVYIEDTDAYGVLYHGNYIRSYERAIWKRYREEQPSNEYCLVGVDRQKFRGSPALGEQIFVEGRFSEGTAELNGTYGDPRGKELHIWNVKMVAAKSKTVYNSAVLTFIHRKENWGSDIGREKIPAFEKHFLESESLPDTHLYRRSYLTHFDEFDSRGCRLPFRSALNYFERSRTDFLLGPESLRRMKDEDGILWVVTSICDGVQYENKLSLLCPGDDVTTLTHFRMMRKGVVTCHHTLCCGNTNGKADSLIKIAEATVTVVALDSVSKKITAAPDWILEKRKQWLQ